MKKLFAMVAAAGMLFVTSCAKDAAESYAEGNDGVVTFTLALENGAGTRTVSDGQSAKDLYYAVYNVSAGVFVPGYTLTTEANTFVDKETTVTFRLVKGQTYKAVFWAQSADAEAFTLEQTANDITMTFDYEGVKNNNEALDAFFAVYDFTLSQSGLNQTITLHRPFAQINLATKKEDYDAAVNQGFTPATSEVVLTNAATTLSLFDGSVTGETEATFAMNDIIDEQLTGVDADGDGVAEEYQYLSMCYVLVPQEKTTLGELSFTVRAEEATAVDVVVSDGLNSVPVQRNWRTNIVGNILLATADFTIIIDEQFDGDYNNWYDDGEWTEMPAGVEYDKENNSVKISTVAGLEWVSKVTNGVIDLGAPYFMGNHPGQHYFKTVELEENAEFDMTGITWQPLILSLSGDQRGTFKGNNATIKNLTVTATERGSAGFLHAFASDVSDLNLDNIKVYSNYKAGALAGEAQAAKITNVHITNAYVESTPWLNDGKYEDANNVGGIVGFGEGVSIEGCSIENSEVYGYRVVGGIAGHAYNATIKNNELTNVKVVANMIISGTYNGTANEDEIAHDVYGRKNEGTTLDANTTTEVTVIIKRVTAQGFEITSLDDLKAIADLGASAYQGKTITFPKDAEIDLAGAHIEPVKFWSPEKPVNIDFNGTTLKNVQLSSGTASYDSSIFSTVTANISNLTIDGLEASAKGRFTGVVGNLYGTLTNVHVKNAKMTTTDGRIAVLVGIHNGGKLIGCSVEDSEITGKWSVGGMVGASNETVGIQYSDCHVKNVHVVNTKGFGGVYDFMAGAITGNINISGIVFENCTVEGCTVNGEPTDKPIWHTFTSYVWNNETVEPDIDTNGKLL